MSVAYKYNPDDFKGLLNLPDELRIFYNLLEIYKADSTDNNRFTLKKHWEDLFFTIKHREVEGFLNPITASELKNYLEELVNA